MRNWTQALCLGSTESPKEELLWTTREVPSLEVFFFCFCFFFFSKEKPGTQRSEATPNWAPMLTAEKKQSSTRVKWVTWPETPGQFLPLDTNPHASPQRHVEKGRSSIRRPRIRKEKRFQLLLKVFTFAKALWSGLPEKKPKYTQENDTERCPPRREINGNCIEWGQIKWPVFSMDLLSICGSSFPLSAPSNDSEAKGS